MRLHADPARKISAPGDDLPEMRWHWRLSPGLLLGALHFQWHVVYTIVSPLGVFPDAMGTLAFRLEDFYRQMLNIQPGISKQEQPDTSFRLGRIRSQNQIICISQTGHVVGNGCHGMVLYSVSKVCTGGP